MTLKYFRQLDGVRAIAALLVMFFHFFVNVHSDNPIWNFLGKVSVFGQTGVSLFFVLSGFLITRILLATKESPRYFVDFYIRRGLRIFPLYYLFLAIYFFIVPALRNLPSVSFAEQSYYWVYLQNFAITFKWPENGPNHFWSLAIEEHFYLIWPCIVYYLSTKRLKLAVAFMLILALICRIILTNQGYEVFYFTFSRMDEIVIGSLLAILEAEGRFKQDSAKKFIIGFVGVLIPTIVIWVSVNGKAMGYIQVFKYNLLALCYFCLVGYAICVKESGIVARILSSRFFTFTGKISYGLYVYHPLCYMLVSAYLPQQSILQSFLISVGISYLAAYASYNLFESRFIALKKYFEYKKVAPAVIK